MIRARMLALGLALCGTLSSCFQYVKGDLPEPPAMPPPSSDFKKLSATYELSLYQIQVPDQGEPEEFARMEKGEFPEFVPGTKGVPSWTVANCQTALRETLLGSGYFASVDESVERGDVHFKFTLVNHGSSFLEMSPGPWTAFAIVLPTWARDDRVYHIEVLQNEQPRRAFDTKVTVMILAWTPLMLAAPFQEMADTRNERIFRAVFADTVARMQTEGAFAGPR